MAILRVYGCTRWSVYSRGRCYTIRGAIPSCRYFFYGTPLWTKIRSLNQHSLILGQLSRSSIIVPRSSVTVTRSSIYSPRSSIILPRSSIIVPQSTNSNPLVTYSPFVPLNQRSTTEGEFYCFQSVSCGGTNPRQSNTVTD